MRITAIAVWSILAVVLGLVPAAAEKRVALIVGMAAYKFVTPLDNPGNDARLIADTLRALNFTLIGDGPQLDLDKSSLEVVVQKFSQQMQGADVALFFYSGHGLQVRGENFLVPVNANPVREADIDFQLMDANLVLRQMELAGTKLNVVILDACRNNPFGERGIKSVSRGLARMVAPEGTVISYATQPGSVALDGYDGNSPYTKALARMVRRPGLNIFETFNEVGLAVMQATGNSQQPWLSSSPIKGRFYFSSEPSVVSSVAVVPPQQTPANDPSAQAWAVTQNTTSIAVLEDFIRQFGSTVYASMARARLDELKRSQVAFVAPPVLPDKLVSPATSNPAASSGSHPFDGKWTITRTGPGCPLPTYTFTITIENSRTEGKAGGGPVKGSVSPTGPISFSHPAPTGPLSVTFSGSLRGNNGNGSFKAPGCNGTFIAKKD